tara:strand:+ start:182 stop:2047 length:1866 start_codon:yes stop_codon:yes gene_type:complete
MTEETIRLNINLENALKSVKAMTDEMEDFKSETADALKAIKETSEKGNKGFAKLTKVVKGVGNGFKGVGLAIKAIGFGLILKLVNKLTETMMQNQQVADSVAVVFKTVQIVLKQVSDVFVNMFKAVSDATGGFDALQKVIGGSLSLAINLIVGSIQGLVLGIQKTQLAMTKWLDSDNTSKINDLESSIAKLDSQLEVTGKRIKQAGSDISEGFVEALDEVGTLAVGISEAVSDSMDKINVKQALSQAKVLVEAAKNYELLALQQTRLIEDYDRQAELQRQIRDNESATISDRIRANEELGKVLQEQGDAEKKTVELRIKAINDRIAAEGKSVELTNELYTLNTELVAVEAKLTGLKSEQLTNVNSLKREELELTNSQKEVENEIAISRAQYAAEQEFFLVDRIEALKVALEVEKEIELERVQAQIDANVKGTQAYADSVAEKKRLDEDFRVREAELNKQGLEAEKLDAKAKLDLASSAFGDIATLLGENSKAGKAAAIAQTTIETYKSAQSAYASLSGIPIVGPVLGALAAAAAIKTGFDNIKRIKAIGKPVGGGAGVPGGGGAAAVSAPPAFNVVGASSNNQLAEAIGAQDKKPVKAFVVSSDVSSQQSLDRNIEESASI